MSRSIDHPPIDHQPTDHQPVPLPPAPLSGLGLWYTPLPESEGRILHELLVKGRQTQYGLKNALKMPISTVRSAIERLEKNRAVVLDEKAVENGRAKKYYALTLRGLAQAIDLLYADGDREQAKMHTARGFEVWSSLCPEFFDRWNDLTDDTETPGASDYWLEFVRQCVDVWYITPNEDAVFDSIARCIWEMLVNSDEIPNGDAGATLKEIPDIWDRVSPLLYADREEMRENLRKMDALLL